MARNLGDNFKIPQIVFHNTAPNTRVNAVFLALVGGSLLFVFIGLFASHVL